MTALKICYTHENGDTVEKTLNKKKCIICCKYKLESEFDKIGEHIIPQSIGNKSFVTYRVCHKCGGGLGGTVDYSLKNYYPVSQARFDRKVPGAKKSVFDSRMDQPDSFVNEEELEFQGFANFGDGENEVHLIKPNSLLEKKIGNDGFLLAYTDESGNQKFGIWRLSDWGFKHNPDVPGAVLKIAYEAAHLYFGDEWLSDITAISIKNVLFSYACRNIKEARFLLDRVGIYQISSDELYTNMNADRDTFIKEAIANRTCLNGLWIAPYKYGSNIITAVIFDIQGLPTGYVLVRHSRHGIRKPVLLAPPI